MYEPVAREARVCPRCCGQNPNPVPWLLDIPFALANLVAGFGIWGLMTLLFPNALGVIGGLFIAGGVIAGIDKVRRRVLGG